MYQAIFFDYDGVIIDSFDYHLREYQKMFPEAGLTAQELADVHNGNFLERDNAVWSKIDIDQYDRFLLENIASAGLLVPGIKELLQGTKADMYIITSGPEAPIRNVLETERVIELFRAVYGKETNASKVFKLEKALHEGNYSKENCVFVTDTLGDLVEANKVGIKSIAVTYGFHPRETLEKGNPWQIIDSVAELGKLLNPAE